VLAVDRWQAFGWLHDDEPEHAVGNVLADDRRHAVVDPNARMIGFKPERVLLARGDLYGATTGPDRRMNVDAVRHLDTRWIYKRNFYRVALTHPDHRARHASAEGPVPVRHAVGNQSRDLLNLEVDLHQRGFAAVN